MRGHGHRGAADMQMERKRKEREWPPIRSILTEAKKLCGKYFIVNRLNLLFLRITHTDTRVKITFSTCMDISRERVRNIIYSDLIFVCLFIKRLVWFDWPYKVSCDGWATRCWLYNMCVFSCCLAGCSLREPILDDDSHTPPRAKALQREQI